MQATHVEIPLGSLPPEDIEVSYWRWPDHDGGHSWYISVRGHLGWLRAHTVTEHEDGTITVSPSILITEYTGESVHGHLVRGVWQDC